MSLDDKLNKISTREDFSSFVDALKNDFIENSVDWENITLETYLDAVSSWSYSMERLYTNLGKETPIQPSWQIFADILLAAKFYE